MVFSIVVISLFIMVNGLLAMTELAVLNSKKIRLEAAASRGNIGARQALLLLDNPSRFLSTIQIGITLIGILAGAYGERSLAKLLKGWLETFPFFADGQRAEIMALGIVVLSVTIASVIFGEIIPKRMALYYPERIAILMAAPVRFLSLAALPLVLFLVTLTEALLRVLGLGKVPQSSLTEEDLRGLIGEGARLGILEVAEGEIMEKVLRLADRRVSALMTPRADMVWLDSTLPEEPNREKIIGNPQSYYPVCSGSPDDLVGLIYAGDALPVILRGKPLNILALMKRPLIIPENVTVLQGLEAFRKSPNEVAFVADEYGAILGTLSQTDVLEALVGELPSPEAPGAAFNVVKRHDGSYLLEADMPVDEMKHLLGLVELPGESEFDTLAGFVLYEMQRIPKEGERFSFGPWSFEIVDMDGLRIDKLLVRPIVEG
jgi:putative hemolysin